MPSFTGLKTGMYPILSEMYWAPDTSITRMSAGAFSKGNLFQAFIGNSPGNQFVLFNKPGADTDLSDPLIILQNKGIGIGKSP